jgi:hypothetical protein
VVPCCPGKCDAPPPGPAREPPTLSEQARKNFAFIADQAADMARIFEARGTGPDNRLANLEREQEAAYRFLLEVARHG